MSADSAVRFSRNLVKIPRRVFVRSGPVNRWSLRDVPLYGILATEVLLQEQGQQTVAIYPNLTCCFHRLRECHLEEDIYINL